MFKFALLAAAAAAASVSAYTLEFHNNCGETIWPGVGKAPNGQPDASVAFGARIDPGGAPATYNVNDGEIGIRAWARTGCDSNGANCATGACNGGLTCNDGGITAGVLYSEFGYQADGNVISWDLSHVDASINVGVSVNNGGNVKTCTSGSCPADQAFDVFDDYGAITTSPVGTTFVHTYCP